MNERLIAAAERTAAGMPLTAEQFLEAPDVPAEDTGLNAYYSRDLVLACIQAAIDAAQPAAEPVAWMWRTSAAFPKDVAFTTDRDLADSARENGMQVMPLCAAQPERAGGDAPDWRELAARVMDALAENQDQINAQYPEHVKCYPSWEMHARWCRWHADMFRTGTPFGSGAGVPAVLAALAAAPQPAAISDTQIAQAVRTLYASDEAAAMGLPDDLRTVRAVLSQTAADTSAGTSPHRPSAEWYRQMIADTEGLDDALPCGALAAPQPAAAEHVVDANKMARPDHLVDLNKMFPPDFNALIGWLADEAHAAIRAAYPAVRTESLDRAVQSYFEAMQPAASTVPARWVSEQCGGEFDDMTAGQGYRKGWNDCRDALLAAAPAAVERQPLPEAECIKLLKFGQFSVEMVRRVERAHGIGAAPAAVERDAPAPDYTQDESVQMADLVVRCDMVLSADATLAQAQSLAEDTRGLLYQILRRGAMLSAAQVAAVAEPWTSGVEGVHEILHKYGLTHPALGGEVQAEGGALDVLRELHAAIKAPFPKASEGQQVQEAWALRRSAAVDAATKLLDGIGSSKEGGAA